VFGGVNLPARRSSMPIFANRATRNAVVADTGCPRAVRATVSSLLGRVPLAAACLGPVPVARDGPRPYRRREPEKTQKAALVEYLKSL